MENDAEKIFTDLKDNISTYAGLKFRLLKLMAIERVAGVTSALSHGLILVLFAFFTVLFLFTALGFYLGELLNNVALGFLIVGGIYFLFTLGFIGAKKGIRIRLMNIIIAALLTNDEHDNDEKDQSTDATRTTDIRKEGNPEAMPGIGNTN